MIAGSEARFTPPRPDCPHDTGPQHVVRGCLDRLVTAGTLPPPLYLPTPRGVCFARIKGSR